MRLLILILLFPLSVLGADEGKYKVAVIDTGFAFLAYDTSGFKLCKKGHYDFSKNQAVVGLDTIGHGAYVTSLINEYSETKNICFIIYKVTTGPNSGPEDVSRALIKAYRAKAKAINISLSINSHVPRLRRIIKGVTNRGIKVYVAAGNNSQNLNESGTASPNGFIGMNDNFVIVGAKNKYGDRAKYSNYGLRVGVWEYGDLGTAMGTSFASPRALGTYIKSLKLDRRK